MLDKSSSRINMIVGVRAIGEVLGINPRRAHYLCEKKMIPVWKLGGRWAISRRDLEAVMHRQDRPAC